MFNLLLIEMYSVAVTRGEDVCSFFLRQETGMNDGLITQPREDEKFQELTLFLFVQVTLQVVQPYRLGRHNTPQNQVSILTSLEPAQCKYLDRFLLSSFETIPSLLAGVGHKTSFYFNLISTCHES